jgi:hypothetical protein
LGRQELKALRIEAKPVVSSRFRGKKSDAT